MCFLIFLLVVGRLLFLGDKQGVPVVADSQFGSRRDKNLDDYGSQRPSVHHERDQHVYRGSHTGIFKLFFFSNLYVWLLLNFFFLIPFLSEY